MTRGDTVNQDLLEVIEELKSFIAFIGKSEQRDYKKEYEEYHGKPKQKKRRTGRNASRRKLLRAGRVRIGDGKDVHHKDHNPANKTGDNLSITTPSFNRSHNKKTR